MSTFLTKLEGEWIDKNHFKLTAPFEYYRTGNKEKKYIVPSGFITDFASIPKVFQWLISKFGKYDKAAVLHDYLYFTGCETRKESDIIFFEAMIVLLVKWWKRRAIYRGVRVGGWVAWNKHRRKLT